MKFWTVVFAAVVWLAFVSGASAQETYSSGQMWGTQPSGVAVPGASESSVTHGNNGLVAGQVNAASVGLLLATGSTGALTIQSIGSQSVVTSTINGNDITSSISASQDTDNTGDVTNDGTITQNNN